MKNKEELNQQKQSLISQLRGDLRGEKKVLEQLREVEKKIKLVEQNELLSQQNAKYQRIRGFALQAWECEQPTTDVTCNDGSFHAVKVKKYPKLAALTFASGRTENNLLLKITINGEKFDMFKTTYESGKPNTYERPQTFEEFLKLNHIPINDFTIKEYLQLSEKLEALNSDIKSKLEEYSNNLKEFNMYSLSCWGLASQRNEHFYTYNLNR